MLTLKQDNGLYRFHIRTAPRLNTRDAVSMEMLRSYLQQSGFKKPFSQGLFSLEDLCCLLLFFIAVSLLLFF